MSTFIQTMVWLLSFAGAIEFGLIALRTGRHWLAWAFGGWLAALVGVTLILGLAEAAFIPRSDEAYLAFHIKAVGGAIIYLVVLGAVCVWQGRPTNDEK